MSSSASRIGVAALAATLASCAPGAPFGSGSAGSACAALAIPANGERLGALDFEGSVRLEARHWGFGGLSGLEVVDETTLLAVTDGGALVRIALSENSDGAPTATCALTELRDARGRPLGGKDSSDAEGLALLAPDRIAVSFEREHRIATYDLSGSLDDTIDFGGAAEIGGNSGLEALARLPSGVLLAGGEFLRGGDDGRRPVWRVAPDLGPEAPPAAPERPAFEIAAARNYGLVGFDVAPGGGLVVLERFYAPGIGNRIRIGWLPESVAAHASGVVTPRGLGRLEGDGPLDVDNFEGVAASPGPDGRTTLWIVSDDNFSDAQKTLLYRFTFDEAAVAAAWARAEEGRAEARPQNRL